MRRVIAKGATRLECTSLSRVSALLINLWIPRITGPDSDPLNTESLLFDHVITLWNFYLVTRCALFFFNAFESGLQEGSTFRRAEGKNKRDDASTLTLASTLQRVNNTLCSSSTRETFYFSFFFFFFFFDRYDVYMNLMNKRRNNGLLL